ncbi:MAG: phage holin family protein [Fibrobacteria bacterium]
MSTLDIHPEASLLRIVKDLRDDAVTLFRQEAALAKRELAARISALAKHFAWAAIGGLLGLYAVFFLLLGVNNLMQTGLQSAGIGAAVASWLAPLLLGMVVAIGGLLTILNGLRSMRKDVAVPSATADSLRENRDWIKDKRKG